MKIVHHGFDGLEFAVKAHISDSVSILLTEIQDRAKTTDSAQLFECCGERMLVHPTGARGGYKFRCDHPKTGIWFIKRPSENDPWGIRFSSSSIAIVSLGLEELRLACAMFLAALGVDASECDYVPSRVDFAVDFILPDFEPDPSNFLVHSNTGIRGISDVEIIDSYGQASGLNSVTVGRMPRRQVNIYNKSKESEAKRKWEWSMIWAKNLGCSIEEVCELTIWRVELRVAKRHLKDKWHVNSWASLYKMLPRIYQSCLDDIRYCQSTADTNRSRWPTHPLWEKVSKIVDEQLFDYIPKLAPEEYEEVTIKRKMRELERQILGLLISTAGIQNLRADQFSSHAVETAQRLAGWANSKDTNIALEDRLNQVKNRYLFLV